MSSALSVKKQCSNSATSTPLNTRIATFFVSAACAVEMVHTASLILDDLPCMDDAELRPDRWDLRSAIPRVEAVGDLFAGALTHQQKLPAL